MTLFDLTLMFAGWFAQAMMSDTKWRRSKLQEVQARAGASVMASQCSKSGSKAPNETMSMEDMDARVELSSQDLDGWVREDKAACSGSDSKLTPGRSTRKVRARTRGRGQYT